MKYVLHTLRDVITLALKFIAMLATLATASSVFGAASLLLIVPTIVIAGLLTRVATTIQGAQA